MASNKVVRRSHTAKPSIVKKVQAKTRAGFKASDTARGSTWRSKIAGYIKSKRSSGYSRFNRGGMG